jgi:RHS repeat-associated protein
VAAGSRQTLIPDTQGSIVSTLDSASGTLGTTGYGAYGEHPSLTTDGPAYTAQHHDPETSGSAAEESGLYYYRARMYSPTLGRFLQPDPSGSDGSATNLYAYVGNDPVNLADPTGLWALDVNFGGAGVSIGQDTTSVPFWKMRVGLTGAGFFYDPAASIPRGASRAPATECQFCPARSVTWQTVNINAGVDAGPLNWQPYTYDVGTSVEEYGRTGGPPNYYNIPATGDHFDPFYFTSILNPGSTHPKVGLDADLQADFEIGGSIPWPDIRKFFGLGDIPSSLPGTTSSNHRK